MLEDHTSAIDLVVVCLHWGGCEIYVDHGVDEPVLVDVTPLLAILEPNKAGIELVSPIMVLVKVQVLEKMMSLIMGLVSPTMRFVKVRVVERMMSSMMGLVKLWC